MTPRAMKCPTCSNKRMTIARVELTPAHGPTRLMDAMFCTKCGTAVSTDKPAAGAKEATK